jgi:fucose 4-O-acetylase-like acetyltransferase
MPMLMFLSGFILSTQFGYSLLNYLKKNAVRLLVPFIVWYLISYYIFVRFQTDISLPAYLFDLMKSPARGLWFLWILFLNSALLFGALKLARYKKQQYRENYFVLAAILLSMTASADFLALADVKQYFPYYAAGFFVCKYLDVLKAKRKIIYTVAIVTFPVLVLGWKRNAFPTFYPVLLSSLNNEDIARLVVSIYKYAVAFGGIALCSFILERIRQTRFHFFLCWLGTLTLDIYVCHHYFLVGIGNGVLLYISASVMAILLSLALTFLILKRFRITKLLLLGQTH